jgi:peptidoglycan/xylan/chitin deacetylase (PgdA/CDA1 family)
VSSRQKGSVILAYHEVMPESVYSYCVTASAFREHLLLIGDRGANSADVQVTFDDGERSQHLHASGILAEHGVRATFFVTPGLIGSDARLLGWSELRELQRAGHSIQSHGWSHKFLTLCSDEELKHEVRASKESLEDHLGLPVTGISVPGGRWDRRVTQASADAGYQTLYVSDPWVATEALGMHIQGRFMVRRTTGQAEMKRILQRDKRMLWSLRTRHQAKKAIVSLIGDGVYHRLWCRLSGYNEFDEARQSQYS